MSARNIYEAPLPLHLPFVHKGSATASHQVNGSPGSNWDIFEREVWAKEMLAQGKNPEDFIAGNACEFMTRYRDDFKRAHELGHNAIRISFDWALVERERGKFETEVLVKWRTMVETAIACGLEVVGTGYHWTHPGWFEALGGWKHSDAPMLYAKFFAKLLEYVGDKVRWWTVFNEPSWYLPSSYRWGINPPREASEDGYKRAFDNMVWAHRHVYALIKQRNPTAMVGIGEADNWTEYTDPSMESNEVHFVDRIINKLDFIGVQMYMHSKYDPAGNKLGWDGHDPCVEHPVQSDMPWGMCPRLAYEVVKKYAARYPGKPIMITEHGHAVREMVDDNRRCWYIWESLKWLSKAIDEGVPLIGYLHWSLLRNFEWLKGWEQDFGLIHVDLKTQTRTERTSAHLLRDIFNAGALTQEIADKYAHVIKHPHCS